jgi:hypothetical protein
MSGAVDRRVDEAWPGPHRPLVMARARGLRPSGIGHAEGMFVWTKRSGRPGRVRFYWWPLVLSIVLSVVLTIILNKLI